MADQARIERANAILKENQEFALALGAQLRGKYDADAYHHLRSQEHPDGKSIKNDTPENLKKKARTPGAFFNKEMRPLRLGTD